MTKQQRIIQIKDAMQALIAKDGNIRVNMIAKKLNDKKICTVTGNLWTEQNTHIFINQHKIHCIKHHGDEVYHRREYVKELRYKMFSADFASDIKARAQRTIKNLEAQGL